jgi:hypothetical protein
MIVLGKMWKENGLMTPLYPKFTGSSLLGLNALLFWRIFVMTRILVFFRWASMKKFFRCEVHEGE